jgi:uncharacterized protein
MVAYDIDGRSYPCHTFQRITIADAASEWEEATSQINFSTMTDFRDPDCSSCIIEGICPNCYGMNYAISGNVLKRDKQLCLVVKVQALANTYLVGEKLRRGSTEMDPAKTLHTIKAIGIIQDQLLGLN